MNFEELHSRVRTFTNGKVSKSELYELLLLCMERCDIETLSFIISLAESDYDGFSHNFELKYPAAVAALYWDAAGIQQITNMALSKQKAKDVRMVAEILAHAVKGTLEDLAFIDKDSKAFKLLNLSGKKYSSKKFKSQAKESLINLMVNLNEDFSFPQSVLNSLL